MKNIRVSSVSYRALVALLSVSSASLLKGEEVNGSLAADAADRQVNRTHSTTFGAGFDGSGSLGGVSGTTAAVGNPGAYSSGNGTFGAYVVPFVLPELGAVENPFSAASVSFTQSGGINTFANLGLDLYGLGRRAAVDVLADDYYAGGLDATDATRLANDFILSNTGSPTASGTVFTFNGVGLTTFLNTAYAGGAGAGEAVFLRLSLDRAPNDFFKTISFHTANATTESLRPVLTYTATAVPEPSAAAVLGGLAALGAVGMRRRGRRG